MRLSLSTFLFVPALILIAACTGKADDTGTKKHPQQDTDTDTDADPDTDADSDEDTDTDDDADADTYQNDHSAYHEFVVAQSEVLCTLWEACGYLDDQGYADVTECKSAVAAHLLTDTCPGYDQSAAQTCVQIEVTATSNCASYDGAIPPACGGVCPPPPDTGAPHAR